MKRRTLPLVAVAIAALSACSGDVVVQAQLRVPDPETGDTVNRPITGMVVRLLPYDRDVVFDSLTRAAATPEPPVPDSLLALQNQVAAAQETWRAAEAEWNAMRDRMQSITREMEGLNRAEARYRELFREFQELDGRYQGVERRMNQAFQKFDSLQRGFITQAEQLRLLREQWADEAFADVNTVIGNRLDQLGRQEYTDTTDAQGAASFSLPRGEWWVHARTELPFHELYWNIPIQVGGEPTVLVLNAGNARVRPKL